ncbi:hypothetical protein EF888_21480 [Silicimonas algicola]|uniref:transferrin-binding protein-like solute binding protein n=1 Tax=Silicimonas algicola TaxID=1826607 RepID=UPI000F84FBCD|nr:transferrin-binding protein-like solute binding protein [Silicimonas algicola]AZQ69493.1 hypothetical protein EF888_21480 [Silicimonas algicola]
MPENGTVRLQGAAKSAAYSYDLITDNVDVGPIVSDDNAYLDITFKNGEATRVVIGNTGAPIDVNEADGAVYQDFGIVIAGQTADGEDTLVAADELDLGYQYQNFGVWVIGYNTGAGTVGTGSFGLSTAAADLPTSSIPATYIGYSAGLVTDGTGYFGTTADAQIVADFAASGVTVSTSNTRLVDIDTLLDAGPAGELDYSGTGTISESTFDASMISALTTGTAEGQFYGPNAEEVGGTFTSSGNGIIHVGSFGAN